MGKSRRIKQAERRVEELAEKYPVPVELQEELGILIADHDRTPGAWVRNVVAFIANQARLRPNAKAWEWAIKAFKRYSDDINKPFAWVKRVLETPEYQFPEEILQRLHAHCLEVFQVKGEGLEENDLTSTSSPSSPSSWFDPEAVAAMHARLGPEKGVESKLSPQTA